MAGMSKVILVSEDPQIREVVNGVLNHRGGESILNCNNLFELRACLNAEDSMVVLVDVDPQVTAMLAELEPMVNRHTQSRFVILAQQRTPQLILRSMQAGVRHVQLKRDIAAELDPVVGALLNTLNHHQAESGCLIPVLSAGGGCGATTVVTNLALEMRVRTGKPVLLADIDIHYGAIGINLNIEAIYGLSNVLNHKSHLDAALLHSTVHQYPGGLDVLLNPVVDAPLRVSEPQMDRFGDLLETCRQSYSLTLLDLPRPSRATLTQAARASSLLLVVMQPTVKDIRMGRALVRILEDAGISASRILIVVNRYQKRHNPISLEQIEKIFNPAKLVCIGNDFANAYRATTEGQPLTKCAPRSQLVKDIAELATTCLNRIKTMQSEVGAKSL